MNEVCNFLVSLAVLGVLAPFTAFLIMLNNHKSELWGVIYERLGQQTKVSNK